MAGRRRFVMLGGQLVEIPADQAPRPRIHLISDHHEPFYSHGDGKIYGSKSAYRRELKARGYEEVACTNQSRLDAVRQEHANPNIPDLSMAELQANANTLGINLD